MKISESKLAAMIEQETAAKALLLGFASDDPEVREQTMAQLRPTSDDYGAAFLGDAVEAVRQHSERMWRKASPPRLGSRRTLLIKTTPAEGLHMDRNWPGGYRKLEGKVQPGLVWHAWKFVEPGETSGLAFDALTRIDGRFVWFPKPFRAV